MILFITFLNQLAEPHPQGIEKRDKEDHEDSDQLLHREADRVLRSERNGMDNPRLRRDCREDYTEISRKPHRHCRDRARLDHEKKRPAIKKSPKRRIGFAQIDRKSTSELQSLTK